MQTLLIPDLFLLISFSKPYPPFTDSEDYEGGINQYVADANAEKEMEIVNPVSDEIAIVTTGTIHCKVRISI